MGTTNQHNTHLPLPSINPRPRSSHERPSALCLRATAWLRVAESCRATCRTRAIIYGSPRSCRRRDTAEGGFMMHSKPRNEQHHMIESKTNPKSELPNSMIQSLSNGAAELFHPVAEVLQVLVSDTAGHVPDVLWNAGYGFWTHFAGKVKFVEGDCDFSLKTGQKVRQIVSKEVPDFDPNAHICTFLPKSFGCLPVISAIPGTQENNGSITYLRQNTIKKHTWCSTRSRWR